MQVQQIIFSIKSIIIFKNAIMATGIDYRVPSIGGRMPSPVTSYHKTGDEVEVYCRIRHVNGIIESSSDTEK